MVIYDTFIFITPTKCGTFSIQNFLENLSLSNNKKLRFWYSQDLDNPIHRKFMHSVLVPTEADAYKRVLMIRNPYERLASMIFFYSEEQEFEVLRFIKDTKNFIEYLKPIREKIKSITISEEYDTRILEEEYSHNPKIDHDKIIFLLFKTLGEIADISRPEYLIKLENIKEDLEKINIVSDIEFPHNNKTEFKNASIKDIFNTQEKIDFANEYFDCAKDAVRFGYKPILTIDDLK
jgi:hypothetical protein